MIARISIPYYIIGWHPEQNTLERFIAGGDKRLVTAIDDAVAAHAKHAAKGKLVRARISIPSAYTHTIPYLCCI